MRDRDGQHGHQKRQGPAVDPLRNPAPISPARDPEHPAITGPEELPAGVEPVGTNPEEVLCEQVGPGNPQGTRTPCPAPPPRRRRRWSPKRSLDLVSCCRASRMPRCGINQDTVLVPARRNAPGRRGQRRRILRPRRAARALPVRRRGRARDRPSRPARAHATGCSTASVAGLTAGQVYGLRAHGPWAPERGHRFNPHRLLLDPYAKAVGRTVRMGRPRIWSIATIRCASIRETRRPSSPRAWSPRRPNLAARSGSCTAWPETVLYEAHVARPDAAAPGRAASELRGTYLGLAQPAVLDHLVRLGVTTVELMPVWAFLDELRLVRLGLRNYWGYNPYCFHGARPPLRRAPIPRPSSAPWSRRCMGPGSRSCSTWCSTTPPRPTIRPHALPARARQRHLLSARSRRSQPLPRLGRLRQQPESRPSARAAAGHGCAAALGRAGRRRLPLRPRPGARPRPRRRFPAAMPPCCRRSPRTPVLGAPEADRRALGPRPERLPPGPVSAAVRDVERPLPRLRTPLLARRRGDAARAGRPSAGLGRPVRGRGPQAHGRASTW